MRKAKTNTISLPTLLLCTTTWKEYCKLEKHTIARNRHDSFDLSQVNDGGCFLEEVSINDQRNIAKSIEGIFIATLQQQYLQGSSPVTPEESVTPGEHPTGTYWFKCTVGIGSEGKHRNATEHRLNRDE